jgi:hypothetical protein
MMVNNRTLAEARQLRLGRLLHAVSHIKYLFWALGVFFQARAMIFTNGPAMLDALSTTLLLYGIAMSLEGLRDNKDISEKHRRFLLDRPSLFLFTMSLVFVGGLFAIGVGCSQFFLSQNRDLAWAIVTFGLGMVALGRQQYDQYLSALEASAHLNRRPSGSPTA